MNYVPKAHGQRKKSRPTVVTLRLKEMNRAFRHCDTGVPYDRWLEQRGVHIKFMLQEVKGEASLDDILERLTLWHGAAGATSEQIEAAAMFGLRAKRLPTADELGKILGVGYEDRAALKIFAFGCCDKTKAERAEIARDKKRNRDRLGGTRRRRAKGVKTREAYLASCESRVRPWEAFKVNPRTWRRWKRAGKVPPNAVPCPDTLPLAA